jgi:RNA polymerase sigma-70 factor (ECF subfamily)
VTPDLDEDALMTRIAAGNEEAFRLLVVRWERDVLSFLIHMLGSVEEAEDLVQDTFVQVFKKAASYRPSGMFKSWLFKIAGNLARSRLRRRKILGWVRFDPVIHDSGGSGRGPDENLEQDQRVAAIQAARSRFAQRQKNAMVRPRVHGLG